MGKGKLRQEEHASYQQAIGCAANLMQLKPVSEIKETSDNRLHDIIGQTHLQIGVVLIHKRENGDHHDGNAYKENNIAEGDGGKSDRPWPRLFTEEAGTEQRFEPVTHGKEDQGNEDSDPNTPGSKDEEAEERENRRQIEEQKQEEKRGQES